MSGKISVLSGALATLLAAAPVLAEGFSGSDLLAWTPGNQRFYLQTSVGMAGVIAAQGDSAQARCIDEWHERQHGNEYEKVLKAVRTYPTYHPQGVILALLRKACGTFK